MKRHTGKTQKFAAKDASAAQRIAARMAELRQRIAQNREAAIAAGKGAGITQLPDTPPLRRRRWAELAAAHKPHTDIREKISALMSDDVAGKDELTIALGAEFLRAAECGDAGRFYAFIEEGFPLSYQDPETGETALHVAAGVRARDVLRLILDSPDCDFLTRDHQGRLASEIAYCFGEDPAAARLLGRKEKQQAQRDGLTLTRRP